MSPHSTEIPKGPAHAQRFGALQRALIAGGLFFLCSAGTCHYHARSGKCHDHSEDPDHHCSEIYVSTASSVLELSSYRALEGQAASGQSILRIDRIKGVTASGSSLAVFAEAVLEANRALLELADRPLFLSELRRGSAAVDVVFRSERPGRPRTRSGCEVTLRFAPQGALQLIEVR